MFACEFVVTASVSLPELMPLSPTRTIHALCPTSYADLHNISSLQTIQPCFILGFLLVSAGALLRIACYTSLGSLHTYEVTLRPSHSLTTSGPYAYARHPSYTAVGMSILGVLTMHFSAGGWDRTCGMMAVPVVKMGWALYVVLAWFVGVSLYRRASVEDEMLRGEFGERWEEWRRDVRWKFVPWVC